MNKAGLVNYSEKWAGKPWGEKFGFAVPVYVYVCVLGIKATGLD